ncbi:MAG: translation initiation factor IF-3 [Anaerolineae bacterium]
MPARQENCRGRNISSREHRINNEIRVREVRLIDETGKQLGIFPTREALRIAEERGYDLVEMAPQAEPPVCRLADYGKFIYERNKRQREARKAQKQVDVKEIRFRPKTADHDLNTKINQARKFLNEGATVRIRVRFRGREITHKEIAVEQLTYVAQQLQDVASVDKTPAMEGRTMLMVLTPVSK